jgi:membrane protease YdiL (CAAX protease family)
MAWIVAAASLSVAPCARASAHDLPGTLGAAPGEIGLAIGICVAAVFVLVLMWRKNVIRPGSFGRLGRPTGVRRDASTLPAGVWFIGAAVMWASPIIGASFVAGLPTHFVGPSGSVHNLGLLGLAGYAFALGCAAFLIYAFLPRAPHAGIRFRGRDIPIGAGVFLLTLPVVLAVSIASTVVATWITGAPPSPIAHSTLDMILDQRADPWVLAVIGVAVIGAPVHEEITYRIFLQSGMLRVLVSPWPAILLTSTLFALVHRLNTEPVPWHAIPSLFTLGVAAGIAYERTGRPGVPIMVHALFNAYNVGLVLLIGDSLGGA